MIIRQSSSEVWNHFTFVHLRAKNIASSAIALHTFPLSLSHQDESTVISVANRKKHESYSTSAFVELESCKHRSTIFYFLIKHEFLVHHQMQSLSKVYFHVLSDLWKLVKSNLCPAPSSDLNTIAIDSVTRKPSPRIFFCHLITEASEHQQSNYIIESIKLLRYRLIKHLLKWINGKAAKHNKTNPKTFSSLRQSMWSMFSH